MKFIVEMDTDLYCKCNQLTELFGEPESCRFKLWPCKGDLLNRPLWCPMKEVKKHYKSENVFYVEVEK